MLKNNWKIKQGCYGDFEISELVQNLGVSRGMAKTLFARGIDSKEKLDKMLFGEDGPFDPFTLPDMAICVERIKRAVHGGEEILIYGDYDADGVTSVALLYLFLKEKGGKVHYHIPDRFTEGYGMNKDVIVEKAAEQGISLIITVDTGISGHNEISFAKTLGIDTVVTDHHECLNGVPEDALAAVNPQRPEYMGFKGFSGVGVAFMVAMAYQSLISGLDEAREILYSKYSDIAAIGTVADVMPIISENRAIVKRGLELIEKGRCHKGITALLVAAKGNTAKVTSQTVGFVLGPRINAAGRMSHASLALSLFLTEDYSEGCSIAEKLCGLNQKRQSSENDIMKEACEIIESAGKQNRSVIVAGSGDWNHGVIGIVCSRIVEKYKKPAILFAYDGDDAKGSGRGVEGLNLAKAINFCSEHIVKYGGHELAAGLTVKVDKLDDFENAINEYVGNLGIDFTAEKDIWVDAELEPNDLTLPFAKELEMLEPYGCENPEPMFLLGDAVVEDIKILSQGKHTKFILSACSICFETLAFNFNADWEGIIPGDRISVLFTLEVNEYMGRKKVTLNMKDFCFDGKLSREFDYFSECYREQDKLTGSRLAEIMPQRADFIPIYKKLIALCSHGEKQLGYRTLMPQNYSLDDYLKMRIVLEVLDGCGLIKVVYSDNYKVRVRICHTDKKINIEESETYLKYKNRI